MNEKLIKDQQDSESKLGLAPKYTALLARLNDSLTGSPSDIRDVVESVSGKHPDLDNIISYHPLGQSYSDYTGASISSYSPDKPSLQLSQWKTNDANPLAATPVLIKRNIKDKIPANILTELSYAYSATNERLVACLPNEFPTTDQSFVVMTTVPLPALGHHLMGDVSFYNNRFNIILNPTFLNTYLSILITTLGAIIYLIKPFTPAIDDITISSNPFEDNVEGYPCTIDLRGNIIRKPIDTINNDSIKPVITN